jgi:hypothetical protein
MLANCHARERTYLFVDMYVALEELDDLVDFAGSMPAWRETKLPNL